MKLADITPATLPVPRKALLPLAKAFRALADADNLRDMIIHFHVFMRDDFYSLRNRADAEMFMHRTASDYDEAELAANKALEAMASVVKAYCGEPNALTEEDEAMINSLTDEEKDELLDEAVDITFYKPSPSIDVDSDPDAYEELQAHYHYLCLKRILDHSFNVIISAKSMNAVEGGIIQSINDGLDDGTPAQMGVMFARFKFMQIVMAFEQVLSTGDDFNDVLESTYLTTTPATFFEITPEDVDRAVMAWKKEKKKRELN